MGLAPYGEPIYKDLILDNIIDLKEDGSFRLDQSYFDYVSGLTMTSKKFSDLFEHPVRNPDEDLLTEFHMNIAASIQSVTEEIVLRITRNLAKEFDIPNLCMAGGVALNCVANGAILKDGSFQNLWVQPAAGDAGGALGAAQAVWHSELGNPRTISEEDDMKGSYLGPSYTDSLIKAELENMGAIFTKIPMGEIATTTANLLSENNAIGWFQGRMEFGPRALGSRSILADPRSDTTQKKLNLKVKYRESFRPFAPSIMREHLSDWFELERDSPYMLLVANVRKELRKKMTDQEENLFGIDKLNVSRSSIPAVTHVDYSARIQTVHQETNPLYHSLLKEFQEITGCPILVNTSFNVRGEPIVCTPSDAFRCFMGTDLDFLVIGNFVLDKRHQSPNMLNKYATELVPD